MRTSEEAQSEGIGQDRKSLDKLFVVQGRTSCSDILQIIWKWSWTMKIISGFKVNLDFQTSAKHILYSAVVGRKNISRISLR